MVETVLGMTDLQIKLVTALGQLSLAATVAYVAWRQSVTAYKQWVTAQKKLKADLFDRRLAAVDALFLTVESIRLHGATAESALAIDRHVRRFGYLFGRPAARAVVDLGDAVLAWKVNGGAPEPTFQQSEPPTFPSDAPPSGAPPFRNYRDVFERYVELVEAAVTEDLLLSH